MIYLSHITFGFLISFIGSLWFGSINMTVTDTAIHKGFRAALWVGAGAAVVEFLQAFIALKFLELLSLNPSFSFYLKWFSVFVFFGLAFYFFFKKEDVIPNKNVPRTSYRGFLKGAVISALNVLAILFWTFIGTYLYSNNLLSVSPILLLIFAIGVALGAFGVYVLYAKIGLLIRKKSEAIGRYVSKVIAGLFLCLGILQLVRNLMLLN